MAPQRRRWKDIEMAEANRVYEKKRRIQDMLDNVDVTVTPHSIYPEPVFKQETVNIPQKPSVEEVKDHNLFEPRVETKASVELKDIKPERTEYIGKSTNQTQRMPYEPVQERERSTEFSLSEDNDEELIEALAEESEPEEHEEPRKSFAEEFSMKPQRKPKSAKDKTDSFFKNLFKPKVKETKHPKKKEQPNQVVQEEGLPEEILYQTALDEVCPDYINTDNPVYLDVEGLFHAYLVIDRKSYPTQVYAGWLSDIINTYSGTGVSFYYERINRENVINKVSQSILLNRSTAKDISDTRQDAEQLDDAIASAQYIKNGMNRNNEDFYYMHTIIEVTGETVEELEFNLRNLETMIKSMDMETYRISHSAEDCFLSSLPLLVKSKDIGRKAQRNILTSGVASCYPFTSFELCDQGGIFFGKNKHNESLTVIDIFNTKVYKNANMCILGTTGAGKTFLLQLIALRLRYQKIQTFIIAPLKGHEFYRACNAVGGTFIKISPSSSDCINIMEIRKIDNANQVILEGDEEYRSESPLLAKIQKLHIFFSLIFPDLDYVEKEILDQCLMRCYEKKGITQEPESLWDPNRPGQYKQMPILGDLYNELKMVDEAKRLIIVLERFVTGSAKAFNQQTNVNLDAKYVVCDISNLSKEYMPIGMFICLDFIWDKTKEDLSEKKAIFIDEAWNLIGPGASKQSAEFVFEVFKTIRGYGGSAIAATQDISDFFALEGGKYGKAILNNAKIKMVLQLEEDEALTVKDILKLTNEETVQVTKFKQGNGLFFANSNHISIEFMATPDETELISTNRDHYATQKAKKEKSRKVG